MHVYRWARIYFSVFRARKVEVFSLFTTLASGYPLVLKTQWVLIVIGVVCVYLPVHLCVSIRLSVQRHYDA